MNSRLVECLPQMLTGKELEEVLGIFPEYEESICTENPAVRLMAMSDLFRVFMPTIMSREIYSKLYLALIHSLQKKESQSAVKQHYENYKRIREKEYSGIIAGADSFTIIGASGIGKSSAISRVIDVIGGKQILHLEQPFTQVVPILVVQCPFDCSVKGLLIEILRLVDETLGTNYYKNALRARATTDMLIGSVAQVALNHIGILVVDEIQSVVNHRNGMGLVGCLTQLINASGISIVMVGTPETAEFFESTQYLARRSLGLNYGSVPYGEEFQQICRVLFHYQYVQKRTEMNEVLLQWFYEHTNGNLAMVVNLLYEAQEIAILSGQEKLSMEVLEEAYQKRMALLHKYVLPKKKIPSAGKKRTSKASEIIPMKKAEDWQELSMAELVEVAKKEGRVIVEVLQEHMTIESVRI